MANRLFSALEAACLRFHPARHAAVVDISHRSDNMSIGALRAACADEVRKNRH